MNQKIENKNEHYENHMAISKVLSLLKTLPCDSVEEMLDLKVTRRILLGLQTDEYVKDMQQRGFSVE